MYFAKDSVDSLKKIAINRHFVLILLSFAVFFAFLIYGLSNGFKVVYWKSAFSTGVIIIILCEILKHFFKKTKYYNVARIFLLYIQFTTLLPLFSAFGTMVSYCASWGNHLANADLLTKLDKMFFGLSWHQFVSDVAKITFLPTFLGFCYDLIAVLPFVLVVVCFAQNDINNIWRFIEFMVITAAITVIIFWLYPVVGPSSHYSFVVNSSFIPSLTAAFNKTGIYTFGLQSIDGFNAVKNSQGDYYMTGIVTFPSYHAVLAVGYMYFSRKFPRIIRYVIYFFGIGMIISAVPIGDHYFIDIVAGSIVAWIGILAVDWQRFASLSVITKKVEEIKIQQSNLENIKKEGL